jgi:uncharacterized UBP type Zn finger protein
VPSQTCSHLDQILDDVAPSGNGCVECLRDGRRWVHLRLCLSCGHVGCCDNSPGRHASKHARATTHPIIRSFEPRETWLWCFPDELFFELSDLPPGPWHT